MRKSTVPFSARRLLHGLTRPYGEVLSFSADLLSYLNAPPQLHLWGGVLDEPSRGLGYSRYDLVAPREFRFTTTWSY